MLRCLKRIELRIDLSLFENFQGIGKILEKISLIIGSALLFFSLIAIGVSKISWHGETMTAAQAEKKWGKIDFETEKFKSGDEHQRALMAASLLKKKKEFLGKDRSDLRKELGDFDGFYFSDMYPTYMIETGKNSGDDSWQLVFLINRSGAISDIIVHKNCCCEK